MQQLQIPPLAEGEVYLCGIVDANGDVEHTVIVGFSDERAPLKAQREWAASIGAALMSRVEALHIYAKRRDLVKNEAYWTDGEVEWDSSFAWCQGFDDGYQLIHHKGAALRAVAVRRFKN